jgi:two-component system, LytTR family, response regulator
MRIVIVDDEPLARLGVRQLLARHHDVIVAGEAGDGRSAVALLAGLRPDVVFLDVQMPELGGFEVLHAIASDVRPLVIFLTAYDTFAVQAFDAHAIDYLVKPVSQARFDAAVARARERLRADQAIKRDERLIFGTGGVDLVVAPDEITWIEADDYYAAVHALGRRQLVRESLTSLEARLDSARFVRVHRSAIVNLAHVREVRPPAAGEPAIVLRDGSSLPISRRRRDAVTAAVRQFAERWR